MSFRTLAESCRRLKCQEGGAGDVGCRVSCAMYWGRTRSDGGSLGARKKRVRVGAKP